MQNLLMRKWANILQKYGKKRKKHADFSTLSISDMKTKKKQICFVGIKILNNSENTTIFTQ